MSDRQTTPEASSSSAEDSHEGGNKAPVKKHMKKQTYLLGLATGVVLAHSWRFLTKEGIKAGVRAGRKLKEVSQQAMEDMEDMRAEAMHELARDEEKASSERIQ